MTINIAKLREIMIEKGLGYTDLSEITGISRVQICRLFKGNVEKTTLKTISKLSKGLEISYKEFVEED